MKSIQTLIPDVYRLLGTKGWLTDALAEEFAHETKIRLRTKFEEGPKKATLRLSKMGSTCPCALWHSIHTPDEAEPLPPWAEFKYAYGHVIEALAITLAKAAGHTVEGEQDEVTVDGITGHRDCVIDGCLVDVKSASSPSFEKFQYGTIKTSDSFGYLSQLDGYLVGSSDDPLVKVKDKGYLWAIDKQLGHMCTYEHELREQHIRDRIGDFKRIVSLEAPPPCTCETEPDGKSGNIKLGTVASYNSYKYCCFPHLRTFLYADKPRYLTKVVRRPQRKDGSYITEVDRYGNIVYN